ncbi:MAG: hypothetical protein WB646_21030 [Steroidobacteraceae bacterium]
MHNIEPNEQIFVAACAAVLLSIYVAQAQADPAGSAGTASDAGTASAETAVRITSSFDVKYAGAVLRQVAKLMHAGFIRRDAEQVARDIDALPADQSRQWEFVAVYKHVGYPLQIRARLDDFGMLDLDFFCAPAVAGPVRSAVDGYLNSHAL